MKLYNIIKTETKVTHARVNADSEEDAKDRIRIFDITKGQQLIDLAVISDEINYEVEEFQE